MAPQKRHDACTPPPGGIEGYAGFKYTQALLTTVAANTVELWPFCSVAATKHSRGALSSNVFCSGVSAPAAPLALLAVRLVSLEEQLGHKKRKLEFVQGPVALNNARVYMRRRLQDCSGRNYKEGDAWSLTPIASTKSEAPAGRTSSRKKGPLDKAQTASGETSARRASAAAPSDCMAAATLAAAATAANATAGAATAGAASAGAAAQALLFLSLIHI